MLVFRERDYNDYTRCLEGYGMRDNEGEIKKKKR